MASAIGSRCEQLVARAVTDQVSCVWRCFVYVLDAIEVADGGANYELRDRLCYLICPISPIY